VLSFNNSMLAMLPSDPAPPSSSSMVLRHAFSGPRLPSCQRRLPVSACFMRVAACRQGPPWRVVKAVIGARPGAPSPSVATLV
jgi:hypothetical protein